MAALTDSHHRYGFVTRVLHWGMALLFAAQLASAAAHALLPREHALRETLWSYHPTLGATLFVLVLLRGAWGLFNLPRRPPHSGTLGRAAVAGHAAIYALMVVVPGVRLLAAAGGTRGFDYLGFRIFAPRETEIAWMQAPAELHGEMGWILAVLIAGHVFMALVWHRLVQRDEVLGRMAG
ncbi:cytochrome b [Palleronia sp. LCG004]|uniref:cytochrome b n=1 Tax=Palleronia sp. LCG004 TaxID=3079304 RepID=UPI0029429A2A|nr:cytochrome b/b6 domain-containing protein [Palleronia sp. LCG004]WOI58387.1 cytochrome b/b6 domain-containing protein [Palleronia sp. LCG004]